jgi:NADPH-dependent 2,4-dienoyl-CoA reductase/sulfur reductase-like enzyme
LGCSVDFAGRETPRIAVDGSFETSKRNVFAIGESARILDENEGIRSAEAAAFRIVSRRARR